MAVNTKEKRKQLRKTKTNKRASNQYLFVFLFCPDNDMLIYHLLDFWLRESPYYEFSISVPIVYD